MAKKAKIRDFEMAYDECGSGEPAIFLMTGLGGCLQNWIDNPGMVEAFSSKHRVIMMDHRGAGESSLGEIENVTMATMADDIVALMDALMIEKAILLGGSMGGMIAQQIAVDHPDRVLALIINATWPGGPNLVRPEQELWEYITVPGCGDFGYLKETSPLRLVFSQKTMDDMDLDALQSIADTFFEVRHTDDIGFQRQQIAIRDFDVADRISGISCPVLVLHGLYDCLIPCENGVTIAKSIPNAKFVLLPNSSHASIEDSELNQQEALAFVEGLNF